MVKMEIIKQEVVRHYELTIGQAYVPDDMFSEIAIFIANQFKTPPDFSLENVTIKFTVAEPTTSF